METAGDAAAFVAAHGIIQLQCTGTFAGRAVENCSRFLDASLTLTFFSKFRCEALVSDAECCSAGLFLYGDVHNVAEGGGHVAHGGSWLDSNRKRALPHGGFVEECCGRDTYQLLLDQFFFQSQNLQDYGPDIIPYYRVARRWRYLTRPAMEGNKVFTGACCTP